MALKYCLFVLILLSIPPCLFSKQQEVNHYHIINRSNENIRVRFRTREIFYQGDRYIYVNYYQNDEIIGRIVINYLIGTSRFRFGNQPSIFDERITHHEHSIIIPFENASFSPSLIDGVLSLHYNTLIGVNINKLLIFDPENPDDSTAMRDRDGFIIRRETMSGMELFNMVFDEFVIYDMSDDVILTLSDIDKNTFSAGRVLSALGENLSEYLRSLSRDGYLHHWLYGIFITPEMLVPSETRCEVEREYD